MNLSTYHDRNHFVLLLTCLISFNLHSLRSRLIFSATKLFVSNVEKQITQDELLQLFAGIGTVKSIELHFDKDGKSLVFSSYM